MTSPRLLPVIWLPLVMAMTAFALGEEQLIPRTEPIPKELSVTLKLPEAAVIGDHIRGEFVVTNNGKTPVTINPSSTDHELVNPWLRVRVWDPRAKILPDLVGEPRAPLSLLSKTKTLGPGESASISCPLEAYVAILAPGPCTVSAWHDLGWHVDKAHPPLVATATVDFKMPNAKYIANRVRTLCATETEENSSELEHLWSPLYLPALRAEAKAGHAQACLGLGSIISEEANEALLGFVTSKDPVMACTAAYALRSRLPSLTDPEKPAIWSWSTYSKHEQILGMWQAKFDPPLLVAAVKLLNSPPLETPKETKLPVPGAPPVQRRLTDPILLATEIIRARGTPDQAPGVLAAMQRTLDGGEVKREAVPIFGPSHLNTFIRTLDALRGRGWRTDGNGGSAATLAYLRQLADPKIPRSPDQNLQELLRTALASKSTILRQDAVALIPVPITDEWEPVLRTALDDEDDAVVEAACQVAAKSGRKSLAAPLVKILESARGSGTRAIAAGSAARLGAGMELWPALCEALVDPAIMVRALLDLIQGTIELPPASMTIQNFKTSDQGIAARDAWKAFLTQNHELLESGKRVPYGDPSITPAMLQSARITPFAAAKHP